MNIYDHTTHNNIFADTADVKHAQHQYTEAEVRENNRVMRQALANRRQLADEQGTTSRFYRFRKGLGKAFTVASVANTARIIKDQF